MSAKFIHRFADRADRRRRFVVRAAQAAAAVRLHQLTPAAPQIRARPSRPSRPKTPSSIRACSARSSNYATNEAPGTVIIDTPHTFLYYVLGNGKAIRYGIGVGREGFTWSGVKQVARKAEWPDWYPPQEMIARQPYLPRMIAGGPGNPLGARAMYLGGTEYRIHGTNDPTTIGKHVSSRLHPPHQRGRRRSLQPRAGRRQGHRAAAERAGADRAACACPQHATRVSWNVDAPVRPLLSFPKPPKTCPAIAPGHFFAHCPVNARRRSLATCREFRDIAQRRADRLHQRHRIGLSPARGGSSR